MPQTVATLPPTFSRNKQFQEQEADVVEKNCVACPSTTDIVYACLYNPVRSEGLLRLPSTCTLQSTSAVLRQRDAFIGEVELGPHHKCEHSGGPVLANSLLCFYFKRAFSAFNNSCGIFLPAKLHRSPAP